MREIGWPCVQAWIFDKHFISAFVSSHQCRPHHRGLSKYPIWPLKSFIEELPRYLTSISRPHGFYQELNICGELSEGFDIIQSSRSLSIVLNSRHSIQEWRNHTVLDFRDLPLLNCTLTFSHFPIPLDLKKYYMKPTLYQFYEETKDLSTMRIYRRHW